jgi:uncharacterized protein YecT (DUF1311 family)
MAIRHGRFSDKELPMRVPAALMVLYLCCFLGHPAGALAAGIDCTKATTPVEKTICADPGLRQADADVAGAFAAALAASPDPAALRADQRQWLATRNACPDAACLKACLAERSQRLATLAETGAKEGQKALWAERQRLRARLGWPADCEESFRDLHSPAGQDRPLPDCGVDIHALGGGRELYLVQCDQFAYQGGYLAYTAGPGAGPAQRIAFPTADADAGRVVRRVDDSLVGDPQFREADKSLVVLTKARGVGDCGTYGVYGFGDGATALVRELRARECPKTAGAYLPPDRWPLVKNP